MQLPPQKRNQAPMVPMRALFWSKVPDARVHGTIWQMLSDEDVTLNMRALMKQFAKKKVKARKKKEVDDEAEKVVSLLDSKRQRNVGIAIARHKLKPAKLKAEFFQMEFELKDKDRLALLLKHAPTTDEIEMLEAHTETPNLGKVEQFFVDMLVVPDYKQRVECALFTLTFADMCRELKENVDTVTGGKVKWSTIRGKTCEGVWVPYAIWIAEKENAQTVELAARALQKAVRMVAPGSVGLKGASPPYGFGMPSSSGM